MRLSKPAAVILGQAADDSSYPWDNLKRYDTRNYLLNGALSGDPGYSILWGIRAFFRGVSGHYVIDPDVRYGAAASLWLLLAKALSPDPVNLGTGFLKRLIAARRPTM